MPIKISVLLSFFLIVTFLSQGQSVKILFDATKAETAGSADWIIDADAHNLNYKPLAVVGGGSESNAQRIPTPAQSGITATTAENYWTGALSFWGIDCVNKGYTVETLPYNGSITYGDATNSQDLSSYNAYIICEPNIPFTASEKTAILNFVSNGGGLFMISDHTSSDRNGDSYDSPAIWNDLIKNNSTGNVNPFGITFDLQNISPTSINLASLPANDSILHGPMGNVTTVKWSNGTSMTLDPIANPNAKAIIYNTGVSNSGKTGVLVASSRYGQGKVVAIGDSSPCDDGTGDPNDALFAGYNGDVTPNHRHLLMNSTIWLVNHDSRNYTFTGNGNWDIANNWFNNIIPPLILPSGDSIIIENTTGGQCILNRTQHISVGASMTVLPGKNLLIPGILSIK